MDVSRTYMMSVVLHCVRYGMELCKLGFSAFKNSSFGAHFFIAVMSSSLTMGDRKLCSSRP